MQWKEVLVSAHPLPSHTPPQLKLFFLKMCEYVWRWTRNNCAKKVFSWWMFYVHLINLDAKCFKCRCSVGWTSGMGWPWPTSGRWRRRPRPSWMKKEIRFEEKIFLRRFFFTVLTLNISGWNQGHCSTGEVGGAVNLLKELATISTTVTLLCLAQKKASKGTTTFCFLIQQNSSVTCRNHSWAHSNLG